MSVPDDNREEYEDHGDVFIDDVDIIQEINIDEEELPDADEQQGSDDEDIEEADDSMHTFTGHTGELYAVACSPIDTTLVATGGGDDKGFMWRIGRGDWAYQLQGHSDSVNSLAFSMDGQLLASGSFDGTVHESGSWAATGSMDQRLIVWDLQHSVPPNTFLHEGEEVTCLAWLGATRFIATGCANGKIRVWDSLSDGETTVKTFSGHSDVIQALAISACGDFLVSVAIVGTTRVFEIEEFK